MLPCLYEPNSPFHGREYYKRSRHRMRDFTEFASFGLNKYVSVRVDILSTYHFIHYLIRLKDVHLLSKLSFDMFEIHAFVI